MRAQTSSSASQNRRIVAGLPFVEALARRMAASMPHSIDIGDLVQDGVIGLIDAAHRFDEARGIKFETFAERRIRGAMIDALRKRCLAARRPPPAPRARSRARSAPARAGTRAVACGSRRAGRIGRKAAGPHDRPHQHDRVDVAARHRRAHGRDRRCPPRSCRPSPKRPTPPTSKPRHATASAPRSQSLPSREQKVIGLYYYGEVDDEADRRRDRRQRIARVAAPRARHPPPARRARRHGPAADRRSAPSARTFAVRSRRWRRPRSSRKPVA